MSEIIEALKDKDDRKAYAFSKQLREESLESDRYYELFGDFLSLLDSDSSFVRTRGFMLCCAQARWDSGGKLEKALPRMLEMLSDDKPTAVRQSLAALNEVVIFRPELNGRIREGIEKADFSKYKDSMLPLILKDADRLLKAMD